MKDSFEFCNYFSKWSLGWVESKVICNKDESFNVYIDPILFSKIKNKDLNKIIDNMGYNSKEIVFGFLQYKMKVLLECFLNGHDLGPSGNYDTFPSERINFNDIFVYIEQIEQNGIYTLNDFKDKLYKINKSGRVIPIYDVAELISLVYSSFNTVLSDIDVKTIECIVKQPIKINSDKYLECDYDFRKNIIDFKIYIDSNIKWAVKGFYVHGSLATLDYVKDFSDLDTFAIIKGDVVKNTSTLLELREKMIPLCC